MVSEQSILELTRSMYVTAQEVLEILGSMKSNLRSLKEELRKEEKWEDCEEHEKEKTTEERDLEKEIRDLPELEEIANQGLIVEINESKVMMHHQSKDELQILKEERTEFDEDEENEERTIEIQKKESLWEENGEVIGKDISLHYVFGIDMVQSTKLPNTNKQDREGVRSRPDSDLPLSTLVPLPISPQPPPYPPFSLPIMACLPCPTMWPNSMVPLSSSRPSANVTQAVKIVCIILGSRNEFRIERALQPSKPNLNPNPENFIGPKTISGNTGWPKPLMDVNWPINSTSICLATNQFWLDDAHRKLPPPLHPPPLPPQSLPPLPPRRVLTRSISLLTWDVGEIDIKLQDDVPVLIMRNYKDGRIVAFLLCYRMGVTSCKITHALEKTNYPDHELYWMKIQEKYHFSHEITADFLAMYKVDFIIINTHREIVGTKSTVVFRLRVSPIISIKHPCVPELTNMYQTIVANSLRERVILGVEGGLDTQIAATRGVEEYRGGSVALIATECVTARTDQATTCLVGISSQREELQSRFPGVPSVVKYLFYSEVPFLC